MTVTDEADGPVRLAAAIAAELRAHSAVAGLGAGHLGVIATHGPNRRVLGVRVPGLGDPVEIGVVLWLRPLVPVADELRARVRELAGDVDVSIEIIDVAVPETPVGTPTPARQPKRKRTRP